MLASSLLAEDARYQMAFWGQVGFYLAGLVAIRWNAVACRLRPASVAASFLVVNAAAWLAFWVWLSGKTTHSWVKVTYNVPLTPRGDSGSPLTALASPQASPTD
jgi:hypothetical protein